MQTITGTDKFITYSNEIRTGNTKSSDKKTATSPIVYGWHKSIVKIGIWMNILLLALYYFKKPGVALKAVKNLKKLRNDYRAKYSIIKYAKTNGKYYFTFNTPGWPSAAFNKYILNNLKKNNIAENAVTLDTIIFGVTKKCGYRCEHCFEWDALNKRETLGRQDLVSIIRSFQDAGISQVQLSGGEPLNRFDDIVYILQNLKSGTEVWLYTSGYQLSNERAAVLKRSGLAGIIISLDHWLPEMHNIFRGNKNAFSNAEKAVANSRNNSLLMCLSICATKDFISQENLSQYAELAKRWGVSFIQLLEPRAVGHYGSKEVSLSESQIKMLEDFYISYNYDKQYREYPSVVYHSFYSRRVGCGGGGSYYIYVDTDGDVHNCPFCQKKIFSALDNNVLFNLSKMAAGGCKAFVNLLQDK